MIRIQDNKDCCGCTACASICAHSAIKMVTRGLGFTYPVVDESRCVDCGMCNKVCSFHSGYNRYDNYETPLIYGCRHKDINELQDSQSGALATAIMEKFLERPGVVYGVAYDNALNVVHKRVTTLTECRAFKGSKYVQSDLTGIFQCVFKDLRNGANVLFFGTPCQIAGLKSFIPGRYHDGLLLVDNICHAVPSPALWRSYREWVERKYHKKVVKTNFRNKEFGWHSHIETFTFDDNSSVSRESFKNLFYNHLIVRPSCSTCYFTNLKRVADITIGDFWGWEKTHSKWNDNKGVSLALINTPIGERFFNSLDDYIDRETASIEECMQPQLIKPIEIDERKLRDVEKRFSRRGYYSVAYKYGDVGYHHKINSNVVRIFKAICQLIKR